MTLRPLEERDESKLAKLVDSLSDETKKFYSYTTSGEEIAKEHIQAIAKYDKLRFVLEKEDQELIGLFEFSFDITNEDKERFDKYNIELNENDCRIGPLLKDDYQSKGLGSIILPCLIDIAKRFNRNRIILWGGVRKDNPQAIRFYEKNGFENVGSFVNKDGVDCYDMVLKLK